MPMYYFALRTNGRVDEEEAEELPDEKAARQLAEQIARELAKNNEAAKGKVIQVFSESDDLITEVPLMLQTQ